MRIICHRLDPNETDHELVWLCVTLVALSMSAAWLALGLAWPRCVFHELTGLPCVTCGMTRCAIQFFHGHFLAALKWNPLVFTALCGVMAFDLYAFANLRFHPTSENVRACLCHFGFRVKLDLSAFALA